MNIVFVFIIFMSFITSAFTVDFSLNATAIKETEFILRVKCESTVPYSQPGFTAHGVVVTTNIFSEKGYKNFSDSSRSYSLEKNKKPVSWYKEVVQQFQWDKEDKIYCDVEVKWRNSAGRKLYTFRKNSKVQIIKDGLVTPGPRPTVPRTTKKPNYIYTTKNNYWKPTPTIKTSTTIKTTVTTETTQTTRSTETISTTQIWTNTNKTHSTTDPPITVPVYESTTTPGEERRETSNEEHNKQFSFDIADTSWFEVLLIGLGLVIIAIIIILYIVKVSKRKAAMETRLATPLSPDSEEIYCRPNITQQGSTHTQATPISSEVFYSQPIPKRERNNGKIAYTTLEFQNKPLYAQVLPKSVRYKGKTARSPYANGTNIQNNEPTYAELQKRDNNRLNERSDGFEGGYAEIQRNDSRNRCEEYSNIFKGEYANTK